VLLYRTGGTIVRGGGFPSQTWSSSPLSDAPTRLYVAVPSSYPFSEKSCDLSVELSTRFDWKRKTRLPGSRHQGRRVRWIKRYEVWNGKRRGALRRALRLLDLSGLDARRAHPHPAGIAAVTNADPLNIGQPPATAAPVRVAHLLAEPRLFTAYFTSIRHAEGPPRERREDNSDLTECQIDAPYTLRRMSSNRLSLQPQDLKQVLNRYPERLRENREALNP